MDSLGWSVEGKNIFVAGRGSFDVHLWRRRHDIYSSLLRKNGYVTTVNTGRLNFKQSRRRNMLTAAVIQIRFLWLINYVKMWLLFSIHSIHWT